MADYDVVLLVEQALSASDAAQVCSLHAELSEEGERVRYHVLLPLEDAAARVEAAMGSLSGGEMLTSPAMTMSEIDLDAVRQDCRDRSESDLAATLEHLRHAGAENLRQVGAEATGRIITEPPVDALAAEVAAVDGREAIILTRPHVVAEFFHLDWTSQARRKLGVPVLHLLEHESFEEQAGGPEGIGGA